jgi:hypothetical protein
MQHIKNRASYFTWFVATIQNELIIKLLSLFATLIVTIYSLCTNIFIASSAREIIYLQRYSKDFQSYQDEQYYIR